MPSNDGTEYTMPELEVRILAQQENRYPVWLTFEHEDQERQARGYLLAEDVENWHETASPLEDGRWLFEVLFRDEALKSAWAAFRGESPQRRVRLRIDPLAPELHAIHWELLRDVSPNFRPEILAADSDTPFSRYLAGEWPAGRPVTDRPIKLLVAIASPEDLSYPEHDLPALNVGAEREIIQDAIAELDRQQLTVTFLGEQDPVTLYGLEAELTEGYHVLHIVAHGKFHQAQTILYLADDLNRVETVSEDDFAGMIERLPHPPHLVYLASCETSALSPADAWRGFAPRLIATGVPAVLAMQQLVSVDTVREFTRTFYRRLLEHGWVDLASNEARAELVAARKPGAAIPVLFSRLPDNRLFASPKAVTPTGIRPEQRLRAALLEQVRERWVEGVLEQSLQSVTRVNMVWQEDTGAVESSWEATLRVPDRPSRILTPDQKMIDLFEEVGDRALLILGPPGSGKTTAVLELARDALARAEQDQARSIPLVFELANWTDSRQNLADWLVAELEKRYQIDERVGRLWVENDRLLLLLDGLERVDLERRGACVQAINQFRLTRGLTPLAVSCESGAYEALGMRLKLQNAIRLQTLAPPRADDLGLELGPQIDTMDVEIHILAEQAAGYQVELTLNDTQQFSGGYLRRERLSFPDTPTQRDGQHLFNWLFAAASLRSVWTQARRQSRRRRLRLWIDPAAAELQDLPWELLRDVMPGLEPQTLAAEGSTPFCRYLPEGSTPAKLPVLDRPVKLLVAVTSPADLADQDGWDRTALDPEAEQRLMTEVRFGLDRTELTVSYLGLDRPLTLRALEAALREDYHVLHLIGHGTCSEYGDQRRTFMLLANEANQVEPVSPAEIATMLEGQRHLPALIVLAHGQNVEQTSAPAWRELAQELVRAGVPAVLATQDPASRDQVYRFFRPFYRQLVRSGRVDLAANEARAEWLPADQLAVSRPPVLYSRVRDNQLFAQPKHKPAEAATRERRNQLILLDRVRAFWVKGVLEASLRDISLIELGKRTQPGAVDPILNIRPDVPSQLPPDWRMIDIFDQFGGTMLILGMPGAGKTFALLQLARDLIARAERHSDYPIPVVFNLSSWRGSRQNLIEWLAEELSVKYQIPRQTGHSWLENNQILNLLDGLDEVGRGHRVACVEAINRFREAHSLTGLAVCSRAGEYQALKDKHGVGLELEGAILLQPLSRQQIDDYLTDAGPELAAVRTTLEHDKTLQGLARTPLMLNIMTTAYRGRSEAQLRGFETDEARRQNLFEAYVDRMFERFARTKAEAKHKTYQKKQTIGWLTWLARNMAEHNRSMFLIEQLQPSWLPSRFGQRAYVFSSRLGIGLIGGLIGGLIISLSSWAFFGDLGEWLGRGIVEGGLGGLVTGLTVGLITAIWIERGRKDKAIGEAVTFRQSATNVLIVGLSVLLIVWLTIGLVLGLPAAWGKNLQFWLGEGLPVGLLFGLSTGLLFGTKGRGRNLTRDIQTVENLSWSPAKAGRGGLYGLVIGLATGLFFGLGGGLMGDRVTSLTGILGRSPIGLVPSLVLVAGLIFGLVAAIFGGLSGSILTQKTAPNQGIRLSQRNALFAGLLGGLVMGLVGATIAGLVGVMTDPAPGEIVLDALALGLAGVFFGLLTAFWYGGLDVIQHYILRFILFLRGCIPVNYARFLDHAVERIFLLRVGGGYIFIHRLLQEYFAGSGVEGPSRGDEG